ncbi:hypothetical protein ACKKBF_B20285 [Auxenochlorella protothecoides x Auxenochlorella symbiontica]
MADQERRVFLTVGTTRFDALVEAVDSTAVAAVLRRRGYTHLTMQIGAAAFQGSRLLPAGTTRGVLPDGLVVEWFDYSPSLAAHVAGAALVVSHAGAGSVFEALVAGVPVVAVPNPQLMDDHQAELARKLEGAGVLVAATLGTLEHVLATADFQGLKSYVPGDPAGMVAAVDWLMGVGSAAGKK